jgi:hypothetical protein
MLDGRIQPGSPEQPQQMGVSRPVGIVPAQDALLEVNEPDNQVRASLGRADRGWGIRHCALDYCVERRRASGPQPCREVGGRKVPGPLRSDPTGGVKYRRPRDLVDAMLVSNPRIAVVAYVDLDADELVAASTTSLSLNVRFSSARYHPQPRAA